MLSKARILVYIISFVIVLFQPAILLAQAKFLKTEQSINFSSTSLGADFTVHFSNTSLAADKTVRILTSPEGADLVIGVSANKGLATYFFEIVSSSFGADSTINISSTSLSADEAIHLTENSFGADLNIYFTSKIEEADFIISSNKDFLPPKYILAILSSMELLDKANIEIIKGLAKDSKSMNLEKSDKHNNYYKNIIESQIDGDFEGWEGETIIKLMNGSIWQQHEYYYHYHYSFMPKVLIYKSGQGYKMKVDGIEKSISVIKLK